MKDVFTNVPLKNYDIKVCARFCDIIFEEQEFDEVTSHLYSDEFVQQVASSYLGRT